MAIWKKIQNGGVTADGAEVNFFGFLAINQVALHRFSNLAPFWKGLLKSYMNSLVRFCQYPRWRKNSRWRTFEFQLFSPVPILQQMIIQKFFCQSKFSSYFDLNDCKKEFENITKWPSYSRWRHSCFFTFLLISPVVLNRF